MATTAPALSHHRTRAQIAAALRPSTARCAAHPGTALDGALCPRCDADALDTLLDEIAEHAVGTWGVDPGSWPAPAARRAFLEEELRSEGRPYAADEARRNVDTWIGVVRAEAAKAARKVLEESVDTEEMATAAEALDALGQPAPAEFFSFGEV